jgi:hypothetical protein
MEITLEIPETVAKSLGYAPEALPRRALARIFHSDIEQRSGKGVKRLEITEPNEHEPHRFFCDRL